jgi:cytochrome d ubiquinol oxidase subunit I
LVSLLALTASTFNIPILSKTATTIFRRLGNRGTILFLSIILLISTITPASLGWFIRETGRKPWTVYGLLYPADLSTPVPINPVVLAAFTITFVAMAAVGIYGMYVVSMKRMKFIELLKKGAGAE